MGANRSQGTEFYGVSGLHSKEAGGRKGLVAAALVHSDFEVAVAVVPKVQISCGEPVEPPPFAYFLPADARFNRPRMRPTLNPVLVRVGYQLAKVVYKLHVNKGAVLAADFRMECCPTGPVACWGAEQAGAASVEKVRRRRRQQCFCAGAVQTVFKVDQNSRTGLQVGPQHREESIVQAQEVMSVKEAIDQGLLGPKDAVHQHKVNAARRKISVGSAQNVGGLVEVARLNAVGQVDDRGYRAGLEHFAIDTSAQAGGVGIAPTVVGGEGDDGHRCTFEAVKVMERTVQLDDVDPRVLYGEQNALMRQLESYFPKLSIVARGDLIKFNGSPEDISVFEEKLDLLLRHVRKFNVLTLPQMERIVLDDKPSILKGMSEGDLVIVHGVNGHVIKARTANQQRMVDAVGANDLTFAMGPAGTGKTYTAVALAVRALKNKEVKRLILTRPAVEAGESLGFLPGDMKEKLDPYMQPLYDALRDMIPSERLLQYLENGTIEIAPLAYMRGRTLDRAFVILDEAQNTTASQMKMFLTRMGPSSKFIVTGDPSQTDLPPRASSGLPNALKLLANVEGIGRVELDGRDVVRHPLVRKIIAAYDDEGQRNQAAGASKVPKLESRPTEPTNP